MAVAAEGTKSAKGVEGADVSFPVGSPTVEPKAFPMPEKRRIKAVTVPTKKKEEEKAKEEGVKSESRERKGGGDENEGRELTVSVRDSGLRSDTTSNGSDGTSETLKKLAGDELEVVRKVERRVSESSRERRSGRAKAGPTSKSVPWADRDLIMTPTPRSLMRSPATVNH